jgi:hypothetical protein
MGATTAKGRESVAGRKSVEGRKSVGPKRNMGKLPSPPRSVMTSLFLLGQLLLFRLCVVRSSYYASMEKTIENIVLSRF